LAKRNPHAKEKQWKPEFDLTELGDRISIFP